MPCAAIQSSVSGPGQSSGVGRHLLRRAADRVPNSSLELGGAAPFVVLVDADVEALVSGAMTAKFRGGGQACTAANRFSVHQSLLRARVAGEAPLPFAAGYFSAPTVLADVPAGAHVLREEIFAPVAPVAPLVAFDDEAGLLRLVNDTEYRLAAYVYGELRRALRFGEQIEAGVVAINRGLVSDPAARFGGFEQSGLGREGASEGLRAFQETPYLSVDWPG